MHKHSLYELDLYSKSELENLLAKPIQTYQLVREWSLSSVHEVLCADNNAWIVKYMREPLTIEGNLYAQVKAPFLPSCHLIIDHPPQQILIYQKIEGLHPNQLNLTEAEALDLMGKLLSAIRSLDTGNLPVRITINTPTAFYTHFEIMLSNMKELILSGQYHLCDQKTINILENIIFNPSVVQKLTEDTGFTHGDLAADNILIQNDGSFVIIDWQRSIRGSYLLDQYLFLESMGLHPLQFLPREALYLAHLERIEWYVATSMKWNPSAIPRIDGFIFNMVIELEKVYQASTR